jgi:hypothetical protein
VNTIKEALRFHLAWLKERKFHANAEFDTVYVKELEHKIHKIEVLLNDE